MKKPLKPSTDKIKLTLSVSRETSAALDRIRVKRLEEGAPRSLAQLSLLVEEAVELLKKKEG